MLNPFIFEAIMLVCFGAAWPVSIYKSYRSRSNKGKSIYFLYIIFLGYLNGIIFQSLLTKEAPFVIYIFILNTVLVGVDIILYHRNMILAGRESK